MSGIGKESVYRRDPFRLFFPLGLAYGVWAISVWVFFGSGLTSTYPGIIHTNLILGGFEMSFIVGFLMTAVPRFTSTTFANKSELLIATFLLTLPAVLAVCGALSSISFASLATFIFLMVFGYRRFHRRTANPPDTFVFVGAALMLGCLSQVIRVSGQLNLGDVTKLDNLSRTLLYHGFILGLVLGIGGRLLPGILGWAEIVTAQRARYEQPLPFYRVIPPLVWVLLVMFLVSFPLEYCSTIAGRTVRACVILFMAVTRWRLHRSPPSKTIHARCIWISSWCIVLGAFSYALVPSMGLESEHIIFIGGYSLLTLMIASRVILAHGAPGSLAFEKNRLPYLLVTILLLTAMLTRFFATAVPESYVHHLAYAGAIWLLGAVIWGVSFVPRIFKR